MVELAGFCSEAATFFGQVIEVALTYGSKQRFRADWKVKHPKFGARFLCPPPFSHRPAFSPSQQSKGSMPRHRFPTASPSDDSDSPDARAGLRKPRSYTFTETLSRGGPAPDSHFADLWLWGKELFNDYRETVAFIMSKVASTNYPMWKEYVALAYLETTKAVLTVVNLSTSNKEIINCFLAKINLLAFLYECTYDELVASRCMSQRARQGLFIDTVLNSAASTTADNEDLYINLAQMIFSQENPNDQPSTVDDAKSYIESRLNTPVVVNCFIRVFKGFGDELSQEDFLVSAMKYLQNVRSAQIKPKFCIYGATLPNHYIILDYFSGTSREHLKYDALLVVFLHELAHALQRRHATTFKEFIEVNTPEQSPQAPFPPMYPDLQSRFASSEDQHFLIALRMIQPLQRQPKDVKEAGDLLERELFGAKVTGITSTLHRFMANPEVWQLSSEAFQCNFQRAHSTTEPKDVLVSLRRSSEISLADNWCHTARRDCVVEEDEEDEDKSS